MLFYRATGDSFEYIAAVTLLNQYVIEWVSATANGKVKKCKTEWKIKWMNEWMSDEWSIYNHDAFDIVDARSAQDAL